MVFSSEAKLRQAERLHTIWIFSVFQKRIWLSFWLSELNISLLPLLFFYCHTPPSSLEYHLRWIVKKQTVEVVSDKLVILEHQGF